MFRLDGHRVHEPEQYYLGRQFDNAPYSCIRKAAKKDLSILTQDVEGYRFGTASRVLLVSLVPVY